LSIYLNGEKQLSKFFSFRPEIGYIEKGYIDTLTFPSTGNSEYDVEIINNRIKLHNLSLNLSVKFYPYETKLKPYLIAGFQGNYFFKYRGFEFKSRGVISKLDKPTFDNFNKFSLNGIIGIGLNYNDLFYIDVEYQPSLTKIYTSNYGLRVWERYVGFTLGLNINKLIDRG